MNNEELKEIRRPNILEQKDYLVTITGGCTRCKHWGEDCSFNIDCDCNYGKKLASC